MYVISEPTNEKGELQFVQNIISALNSVSVEWDQEPITRNLQLP